MPRIIAERADAIPGLAEAFRAYGYEGASLSRITTATGLGKGSLYHFFPGGKNEMMAAVLADINAWFEANIFTHLTVADDLATAITTMFTAVTDYFRSGQRVCLVGVLGLGAARGVFADAIADYFSRWVVALRMALQAGGLASAAAQMLAEETVAGIQGAIVLSRALNDPEIFHRVTTRLQEKLLTALG
jgi:AcrR family transcriptional regulator